MAYRAGKWFGVSHEHKEIDADLADNKINWLINDPFRALFGTIGQRRTTFMVTLTRDHHGISRPFFSSRPSLLPVAEPRQIQLGSSRAVYSSPRTRVLTKLVTHRGFQARDLRPNSALCLASDQGTCHPLSSGPRFISDQLLKWKGIPITTSLAVVRRIEAPHGIFFRPTRSSLSSDRDRSTRDFPWSRQIVRMCYVFTMSILGCAETIPNGVGHAADAPSLRRPSCAKHTCSRALD